MSWEAKFPNDSCFQQYADPSSPVYSHVYDRNSPLQVMLYCDFKKIPTPAGDPYLQNWEGCADPRVIDCIEWRFDGSVSEYEKAVWREQDRRHAFRQECAQRFPILKKLRHDVGFWGSDIWERAIPLTHHLHQKWRHEAWSMWTDIPQIARKHNLTLTALHCEPLPGPWRHGFL